MVSPRVGTLALLFVLFAAGGAARAQNDFDEEFDEEAFPLLPPEETTTPIEPEATAEGESEGPSDAELIAAYQPPPPDPEGADCTVVSPDTSSGPTICAAPSRSRR